MSRQWFAVSVLLVCATTFTGCGMQKGKTIFTAGPNTGNVVGTAPDSGTYQLYTSLNANPIITLHLNQGDVLGFRQAPGGGIEAVYQDQKYDLPKDTAQAYWKLQ